MEIRARQLRLYPLCAHCELKGVVRLAQEVDHINPVGRGAPDDSEDNLSSLCIDHHRVKTAKELGYKMRDAIGLDGFRIRNI